MSRGRLGCGRLRSRGKVVGFCGSGLGRQRESQRSLDKDLEEGVGTSSDEII
jgi:hypothetical protein